MSQSVRDSTTISDDEDDTEADQESSQSAFAPRSRSLRTSSGSLAVLLRDEPRWLSHFRALQETDVIILLTPVVPPVVEASDDGSDPFEPFGRSLSRRHQRVRHVPYTHRNGITSTHLGFIKRGNIVILCFVVPSSQQIHSQIADVVFAVSDDKPCIIVVCCGPNADDQDAPFPTLIQCSGYTPQALEATVQLMFGESSDVYSQTLNDAPRLDSRAPRLWAVEQWNETSDIASVYRIWIECVDQRFSLDKSELASLLHRPGYGRHYVVRDPDRGHVLGFCATFLSYVDQEGEKLIASLAILLVPASSRRRGIGLSLHSHAMAQLKRTRGVIRLQLGSTYPRILHGPSYDVHTNEEWIHRRGWKLNRAPIRDLILDVNDWQPVENPKRNLTFRICTQADMGEVLVYVERASTRQSRTGWFDQYSALMGGPNVKDVILGLAENTIIATALTYTPACGSQIASNLPWAGRIGSDVGGITCVCIDHFSPRYINTREPPSFPLPLTPVKSYVFELRRALASLDGSTSIGLLNACIQKLNAQGMKKVFMDGITEDGDILAKLGFKEWAKYRDVWRDV